MDTEDAIELGCIGAGCLGTIVYFGLIIAVVVAVIYFLFQAANGNVF